MITCPFCSVDNLDGADVCEACGQPLDHLSKPRPAPGIEERILKDRVPMLAPAGPVTVQEETPVAEVLALLKRQAVGCVVVLRGRELAGIFSERDALLRLGTRAAELGGEPISRFMTPSPATIELSDKIAFALHKMDLGGYRHLPVLASGEVVGMISVRDVLKYLAETVLHGAD